MQCTYPTSLPAKSMVISVGRLPRAAARRAPTSGKSATHAAPGWRLPSGVSNVSHDLAPNARRIPTAYGESCIFCFNRIRIGMHASNTKRDSIQTLLFGLVSQPARLRSTTDCIYKLDWSASWGGNSVSSCRSYSAAKGPATSAGAFPMVLSLSGEDPRGPRRGAMGSCGTPGAP